MGETLAYAEVLNRMPLSVREVVDSSGASAFARTVYCPIVRRHVPISDCARCEHFCSYCLKPRDAVNFLYCSYVPEPCYPDAAEDDLREASHRSPLIESHVTPISELMDRFVLCFENDVHPLTVARILQSRNIRAAPVIDHLGHPEGVIYRSALRPELIQSHSDIAQLMHPITRCLPHTMSIADTVKTMHNEGISHAPVTEHDRVVGLVHYSDLLNWIAVCSSDRAKA